MTMLFSADILPKFRLALLGVCSLAMLSGCGGKNELVLDSGVGVNVVRSACPAVGIPVYTGDITTFSPVDSRDANAIDMVASITNVRSQCNDAAGDKIYTATTFDVLARRTNTRGARQVTLPYFTTVMRGGTAVISKRLGAVTISFADGQERAQASGTAGSYVDRAEASLPDDVRERLTRKRRAGDADAAIDPLSDPQVRAAVARASFEQLIGFQLTPDQLQYNATR